MLRARRQINARAVIPRVAQSSGSCCDSSVFDQAASCGQPGLSGELDAVRSLARASGSPRVSKCAPFGPFSSGIARIELPAQERRRSGRRGGLANRQARGPDSRRAASPVRFRTFARPSSTRSRTPLGRVVLVAILEAIEAAEPQRRVLVPSQLAGPGSVLAAVVEALQHRQCGESTRAGAGPRSGLRPRTRSRVIAVADPACAAGRHAAVASPSRPSIPFLLDRPRDQEGGTRGARRAAADVKGSRR